MSRQPKIKTVIVDDEAEARDGIQTLLNEDQEIEIISICDNGLDAILKIGELKPDLLLLDIQMPEINGFEVLKSLSLEDLPAVVFVTAYDKYALRAFEVHAVDYLLKPFTKPRFFDAIDHAKQVIKQSHANHDVVKMLEGYEPENSSTALLNSTSSIDQEKLIVKSGGKIHFISHRDVYWLEADDVYVRVHTNRKAHLVRATLKQMEQRLPQARFIRVHKSFMVNFDKISEIEPLFNSEFMITLLDGTAVKVSRTYASGIRAFLK